MLSPSPIEAADRHGAAVAVEPGLNVIAHVGRSVDPGVLTMRNTDFLPLCVPDQIRGTLQGLHLADQRYGGWLSSCRRDTFWIKGRQQLWAGGGDPDVGV